MPDESRGDTPGSAPADPKVVTPAEAPAASASSLPAKQDNDFDRQVREAKTPAELKAVTDKMIAFNSKKPPVNADPAAPRKPAAAPKPAAAEEPAAEPAAEDTPDETTPEAEAETPAEDAPAAETADDATTEEPEADGPDIPTSKNLRVRLPEDDRVGRLALSLKQRNRDWTMDEAMDRAKSQLGIKPTKAAADEPAAPKGPNADLPQTVSEIDSAVDKLLEERTKATIELRFEDQDKIDKQLRRLDRHRVDTIRSEERSQTVRQQEASRQYDEGFSKSEARAAELYEFASDPKSAGAKRMLEIEADLKDNGDPLYHSPDKPLKIAQMVAREMNIAPRKKGTPVVAKAPPVVAAPKKNILPGGSSRTVPVTKSAKPADIAEVESIKNMADLRAYNKKHGIGQ